MAQPAGGTSGLVRLPVVELLLLRHAEAERKAETDFARPLSKAGREAAAAVGVRLAGLSLAPDRALASPAPRALETATLAAQAFPGLAVAQEPHVYDASLEALLRVLSRHGGDARRLLLVGHNPGLSHLTAWLASVPPDWSLGKASVAHLRLRAAWTDLSRGCARLVQVLDAPTPEARPGRRTEWGSG